MRGPSGDDANNPKSLPPARETSPSAEPLTRFFARAGLGDVDIERVEAAARDEAEQAA
jgi:hypothetical protein